MRREGKLEVICGSMFCGKSEELIRRCRRAVIAKQKVVVFSPAIDNRRGQNIISTHNGEKWEAISIGNVDEMRCFICDDTDVIAIDEVQFLGYEVIRLIEKLIFADKRIIVAGLDTDFRGEPFGCVPALMALSTDVTKLHAICAVCQEDANRTQRIINGKPAHWLDPVIYVGASESYEARCLKHHVVPGKPE